MAKRRDTLFLAINGKIHSIEPQHAHLMLSDYLRDVRGLTGTKVVCAEGDCGACTALRYYPLQNKAELQPFNTCIAPLASLDGAHLITVEGLKKLQLHPAQEAMVECHASQCGFCTPGFVMAIAGLCEKKNSSEISEKKVKNALTGNLCRCTGYQSIVDAGVLACKKNKTIHSLKNRYLTPTLIQKLKKLTKPSVFISTSTFTYFAPKTLAEALHYYKVNTPCRILGAATDLGVVHNKYRTRMTHVMSLHHIPELYRINKSKTTLTIGARTTIAEFRKTLQPHSSLKEFAQFIDLFASPQIKNVATVVGNIANASPIADLSPPLLALGAIVCVQSHSRKRKIPLDRFFLDYRKTALKKGEVITALQIPIPYTKDIFTLFKSSQRKDLDISSVNSALLYSPQKVRLAVGGIAPTTIRLKTLEAEIEKLYPKDFNQTKTIQRLCKLGQEEITPIDDLRGSSSFRRAIFDGMLQRSLAAIGKSFTTQKNLQKITQKNSVLKKSTKKTSKEAES